MVTDEHGCLHEHSISVEPEDISRDVLTANIFTPDEADNNQFLLHSEDDAAYINRFRVFTRWGVPVHDVGRHQINDESKAWLGNNHGGTPLPADVYVYIAEVQFIDGSKKMIRGDILLVR